MRGRSAKVAIPAKRGTLLESVGPMLVLSELNYSSSVLVVRT
jgi:hypothetical protein